MALVVEDGTRVEGANSYLTVAELRAFAGDRGLTFPELTASATSLQASEIKAREDAYYISANRACEIGMTTATGKQYRHVIEVLEELSR